MSDKNLMNALKYCLITFPTTHSALHAEKVLQEAKASFLIVPTPREISSGCGLSVRIFGEDLDIVLRLLSSAGILATEYFRVESQGVKNVITSIRLG